MGDFNARKGGLSDSTENGLLNDFQLTSDSDQQISIWGMKNLGNYIHWIKIPASMVDPSLTYALEMD